MKRLPPPISAVMPRQVRRTTPKERVTDGHYQTSKPDQLRGGNFRPFGIFGRGSKRIATYLTTANLTGHDSHGVIRVPVYIRWKKMGSVVPDQTVELVVDTPSLAVIDGKFGYGQTVTPQAVRIGIEKCKKVGPRRGGAAQCRAYRPRRRLGRNGGRRRAGVDPLRQRRGLAPGRALWRRREAAVDRALLRRHSAPGPGPDRAGFRHLDRRRRQGVGRKPRRQETAEGRADRCRRHA